MKPKVKRGLLALVALTIGVLGIQVVTIGAAHAATVTWHRTYAFTEVPSFKIVYWDECRDGNEQTIYLEQEDRKCGQIVPIGDPIMIDIKLYGYARLTTISTTNHRVHVCLFEGTYFYMEIDQADDNGKSTGHLVQYPAFGSDPCYDAVKGYKMRKFTAAWDGPAFIESPWTLPA